MWFQDLLLLLLLVSSIFLIGVPLARLAKMVLPKKSANPLVEAKVRLEKARLEAEAAHLNKETEKVYNTMLEEVLQDDDEVEIQQRRRNLHEFEK